MVDLPRLVPVLIGKVAAPPSFHFPYLRSGSQVACLSLKQNHATFTPDTTQAVNGSTLVIEGFQACIATSAPPPIPK